MHMRERDLTTIFKKPSVAPGLDTNKISFYWNVKIKDSPQTVNCKKNRCNKIVSYHTRAFSPAKKKYSKSGESSKKVSSASSSSCQAAQAAVASETRNKHLASPLDRYKRKLLGKLCTDLDYLENLKDRLDLGSKNKEGNFYTTYLSRKLRLIFCAFWGNTNWLIFLNNCLSLVKK